MHPGTSTHFDDTRRSENRKLMHEAPSLRARSIRTLRSRQNYSAVRTVWAARLHMGHAKSVKSNVWTDAVDAVKICLMVDQKHVLFERPSY